MTSGVQPSNPATGHVLNRCVDEIFVVNLPFDTERRLLMHHQLNREGIAYTLYPATNGLEGPAHEAYLSYLQREPGQLKYFARHAPRERRRGSGFIESAGAVGYLYTYVGLLEEALRRGLERILILEDDVMLCRGFAARFEALMRCLPGDWKVLQLGASQYHWRDFDEGKAARAGYYLPRQLDTCGSFAIALEASVMPGLIEAARSLEAPFDHLPLGEIYERHLGECFVAFPNIVIPDVTRSHIREAREQRSHAELMKWPLDAFEYPAPRPIVALLADGPTGLPGELLRQQHPTAPFHLNVYVNTPDGLRPVHDDALAANGQQEHRPFPRPVELPAADFCFKLTAGASLGYAELLAAVDDGCGQSAKLSAWPFRVRARKPGRVSVIIPTFGRVEHLTAAIGSVLSQTGVDLELLVIDDNGPDSPCAATVRSQLGNSDRALSGDRLIYIAHARNRNGAAARNTGLLASTGEFVCFLDDDDLYLPGRLSAGVASLQSGNWRHGGVYCGFLGWNSPANDPGRYPESGLARRLLALDYGSHYIHTATVTYRASELFKTNGFDESYPRHQDLEFNLRFLSVSSLGSLAKPLVRLKPSPADQDNRLFGLELYRVKRRFLADFRALIDTFGGQERAAIYRAHARDLVRYVRDEESFLAELQIEEQSHLGMWLYTLLKVGDSPAALTGSEALGARLRDTRERLDDTLRELAGTQRRLREIEQSLTWRISRLWRFLP